MLDSAARLKARASSARRRRTGAAIPQGESRKLPRIAP